MTETPAPSTPEPDTMDGSTNFDPVDAYVAALEDASGMPETLIAWAKDHQANQPVHEAANPHGCPCGHAHTTEPVTSDRPVMPVVARMLDLDAIEADAEQWRRVAKGGGFGNDTVALRNRLCFAAGPLVAEVREILADRERWVDRWDQAHSHANELEQQRSADAAQLGTLSVAVGKVAQLHQDDGDGYCRACQTSPYPCTTAKAIGVEQ